jgi:hypothetical protein
MLLATVAGVFLIPYLYFIVQRMSAAVGRKKAPEPVPEVG